MNIFKYLLKKKQNKNKIKETLPPLLPNQIIKGTVTDKNL